MNMPVAAAQTLQYTSPLFVAGFSAIASFRNGEHIDWRILAAIVSAFVGILVMFHPSVSGRLRSHRAVVRIVYGRRHPDAQEVGRRQ